MALPAEKPDDARGWAETRHPFPRDEYLRRHGWRIAARPRRGPAAWERRGRRLAEAEALAVCDAEVKGVAL